MYNLYGYHGVRATEITDSGELSCHCRFHRIIASAMYPGYPGTTGPSAAKCPSLSMIKSCQAWLDG
eukprot:2347689-Rhodomonas_salina.1